MSITSLYSGDITKEPEVEDEEMEIGICKLQGVDYKEALTELEKDKEKIQNAIKKEKEDRIQKAKELIVQKDQYSCRNCKTNKATDFITDTLTGDMICLHCGAVACENYVYEGDWTRNFEDEESNQQNGVAPDPLFSTSHNLRTLNQCDNGRLNRNIQQRFADMEMDATSTNRDEKRTRIGYKDKEKFRAFGQMKSVAYNLSLHESVYNLACWYFYLLRDSADKLKQLSVRKVKGIGLSAKKDNREYQSLFKCDKCGLEFNTKQNLNSHGCYLKRTIPDDAPPAPREIKIKNLVNEENTIF
ncbi:hypothetical protein WA158_000113 [Blastocystis sp. Blastoise]